ncbi:MAG: hypothetical protein HY043_01400 [Verrucomicrobia bacterium]|nr:hypothetical protein [Verrucomicrobiota bacterium]
MLILSWVMLVLERAGDGSNPYLLRFGVFLQLSAAILLVFRSLSIPRESIVRLMLAASGLSLVLSVPALALAHGRGFQLLPSIYQSGLTILSIPLSCYWLWCLYWFIRREYLTMAIRSKTNWPPAIQIAGVSWWGRINVAADLAYGMAPAIDADAMFKELGAMVTDIQTLGDHGIQKWLQIERDSIAKEANKNREEVVYRKTLPRYALATIVLIGLFVGAESMWYASGAKKALALQMRNELANTKRSVENDPSVLEWVPKMLASAEQETAAGESAFGMTKYTDSMAHWKLAINTYTNIPNAAAALKNASTLQSQHKTAVTNVYLQEAASERLKTAALMKDFAGLMDQHPNPNELWNAVKQSAEKAKGLGEVENWDQSGAAWERAGLSLPQAIQLMRADIWVKLAEVEVKKTNANAATNYAQNALRELPRYSHAMQREELAMNMIRYDQLLSGEIEEDAVIAANMAEFIKRLDLSGGGDWSAIKGSVEKARTLANQNEWDKCNDEWKNALSKMPSVILVMRMEKLEAEARRGNWASVSTLARRVLHDHSAHSRANELKKKADSIESARAAEVAYRKALSGALDREVTSDHVKIGDMTDFIAYMDRYGREEWAQVKDALSKAEAFRSNEQGSESSSEWTKARAQFPSAVQRMRAELWMEQAETEAKNNNWTKALVYAENALKEKPDHVRAKQLRDQADGIEEKRLLQTK